MGMKDYCVIVCHGDILIYLTNRKACAFFDAVLECS